MLVMAGGEAIPFNFEITVLDSVLAIGPVLFAEENGVG